VSTHVLSISIPIYKDRKFPFNKNVFHLDFCPPPSSYDHVPVPTFVSCLYSPYRTVSFCNRATAPVLRSNYSFTLIF
jgi:hypothetical protein